MLTLFGKDTKCCDGIPRRSFLKVGFLGLAGLSLPEMLRVRAQAAAAGSSLNKTSVIFIELAGGASHFETYDPKPEAPAEYRGHFGAIRTRIPGEYFCELMPEQAKISDKLSIVRSVHHDWIHHSNSQHLILTGYIGDNSDDNINPSIGSVTSVVRGPNREGLPAYVALPGAPLYTGGSYLGRGHNPFVVPNPNSGDYKVKNLAMSDGLTANRLNDRRSLLKGLDNARRMLDNHGVTDAMDQFNLQAFDMVTNDRARNAFDISQEDPALRDRYGRTTFGQSMLLARRLVEAGVTFANVSVGGWDFHDNIKSGSLSKSPPYDKALAALISDLRSRGLDRDVLVLAMGEFGRTPRINKMAGRDHWGPVMSVLFAGGGLRMGQIVGASNRKGEEPIEAPYRPENVLAMVYRHLGINPSMTFNDFSGRPRYILEGRELIKELI